MSSIRLATWNLQHGVAARMRLATASGRTLATASDASNQTPGSRNPLTDAVTSEALATATHEAIRDAVSRLEPDVLALQEVDRNSPRSGYICHTEMVAADLTAEFVFCPTLRGVPGESWEPSRGHTDDHSGAMYGIGLVTRLPVRTWHSLELPASRARLPLPVGSPQRPRVMWVQDEPRWALAAELEHEQGTFTAITTHLSFVPGVNMRQLAALTRWARRLPGPVVLLGDLNLPAAFMSRQRQWQMLAQLPTYPSGQPRIQFDHLCALKPTHINVTVSNSHDLLLGDHRALTADVRLGAPQ